MNKRVKKEESDVDVSGGKEENAGYTWETGKPIVKSRIGKCRESRGQCVMKRIDRSPTEDSFDRFYFG